MYVLAIVFMLSQPTIRARCTELMAWTCGYQMTDRGINMDILQSVIGNRAAGLLISGLMGRGFNEEQAETFLPLAGNSVISAFRSNAGSKDTDSILEGIDIRAIASRTGLDNKLVSDGMQYVIPNLLSQMDEEDLGIMYNKVKQIF